MTAPAGGGRPVWVHAWACRSSFGGWPATVDALMAGRVAVRPIDRFDATRFPCTVAAPLDAFLEEEDRRTPLVLAALADLPKIEGRMGVFLGAESGRGRFETLRELVAAGGRAAGDGGAFGGGRFDGGPFDVGRWVVQARGLADRLSPAVVSPAAPAVAIARALGARGPVETLSLACASGLAAIVEAARAIAAGECDVAVAGGVGADVDPLMLAGFGKLQALSAKGVSRPFDRRRDGFVVGEGAALVVLAATPGRARVAGVGRSVDAVHLTMPDPDGRGAEQAMRDALDEADVDTIDVVQAHGTSTPLNDAVEAATLGRLGARIGAVSSVKGALGHWIAGAGALGFCCAAEAVASGRIVPTAGLSEAEDGLPHVIGVGVERRVRSALVNALAFGGANASVVVTCE